MIGVIGVFFIAIFGGVLFLAVLIAGYVWYRKRKGS
jgi:hypothetical protein